MNIIVKNTFRWILVLPGAIAAMILVNTLNGLTVAMIFPDFIDEVCKSWFGSLAFVMTSYYIAPNGKVVTAIVVATAYCAIGLFAVVIALRSGESHHPAWIEITTTIISIIASVLACLIVYSFDKDKKSQSLKESQRN
jgi:putative Ca2+/H+ antiporter (TMEM165/GDT1 family)